MRNRTTGDSKRSKTFAFPSISRTQLAGTASSSTLWDCSAYPTPALRISSFVSFETSSELKFDRKRNPVDLLLLKMKKRAIRKP